MLKKLIGDRSILPKGWRKYWRGREFIVGQEAGLVHTAVYRPPQLVFIYGGKKVNFRFHIYRASRIVTIEENVRMYY